MVTHSTDSPHFYKKILNLFLWFFKNLNSLLLREEKVENGCKMGGDLMGKKYFMKNFHKKLIYYEKYHYFSKLNEDVMKCNEAIITFE